ncbi:MAG TPA: hypothetical protein VGN86_14165 [Pyrinomonadaceae bacterium]|jgi:hypothetical protein|nr:hypothetical protein [Pyrinomonadaceae bacterium]
MSKDNRRRLAICFAVLSLLISSLGPLSSGSAAPVQSGPTLLKYSMQVTANRLVRYWKAPETDNYWSWMPKVNFLVMGPIVAGTVFTVDFINSDGTPWYSVECFSDAIPAGRWTGVGTPAITTHIDKRTTLATGVFGFKIRMKNEVMGTNADLFTGKFKVNKFHVGNNLPQFKNQFEYYVDQDWSLPIGYLWLTTATEPQAPVTVATMWFRGESDSTKLAAYLFYNGKQIASTKESTGGAASDASLLTSGNDTDPRWERWNFRWYNVRAYNTDTSNNNSNFFLLATNPGEYEVKVLRDGDLARSMKFNISAEGKFVDNGVATANKLGWYGLILPVKVLGASDGTWDATAWKTMAYYGNPLTGFSVP